MNLAPSITDMHDRVVVITGGNSGIGLETAVGLAGRGARVVLGCRNTAKAESAVGDIRSRSGNDAVEARPLDLADLASVRAFAAGLSDLDRIDVLINNAGLVLGERRETAQGIEATFGTNHVGHYVLTDLLLDQVRAAGSGRVVCVASEAHRAAVGGLPRADLGRHTRYNAWRAYGDSKLANILHAEGLARRLEGTGVVAHSLHPGSVGTNFGKEGDTQGFTARLMEIGNPLLLTPAKGARTSIHVATSPEAGATSGLYWVRCRPRPTAPWTRRAGDVESLRVLSDRLVAAVS